MSDWSDLLLSLGPALYWKCDETSGTQITDYSGNGRHGTVSGNYALNQTGPTIFGDTTASIRLNYQSGQQSGKIVSTYDPFVQGTDRTYIGWVNKDALTSGCYFGGEGATAPYFINDTDEFLYYPQPGATPGRWYTAETAATAGTWFMYAVVHSGTSVTLYINGVGEGTDTGIGSINDASGNYRIPEIYTGGAMVGYASESAVFEAALSATEIGDLWEYSQTGVPAPGPSYPSDTLYPEDAGLFPGDGGELPPTVTTGAESDVSYFSATLNGTVDPNGLQTHYRFEYGLTTAYGSETPEWNIGTGTDPVSVDDLLFPLVDNTTYHYRLVAWNGAGTSYGEDGVLTTLDALPPVVVTGAATDITSTSATLNGTVDPEDQDTAAWFEYGLTSAYGSNSDPADDVGSGTDPVAVSAVISVDPFAIYHYRLAAWSLGGYSYGEDRTFSGLYGPAPLALIHEGGKGQ